MYYLHSGLLVWRVVLSSFFLTHGLSKWERLFADEIKFGNPIGLGPELSLVLIVIAEVVAPLFIIMGFKTRWATLFPIIAMGVAAFVVHADDSFGRMEKALLYLFGYLLLAMTGPGKYSLDHLLDRERRQEMS